jgi:hypothetical protein
MLRGACPLLFKQGGQASRDRYHHAKAYERVRTPTNAFGRLKSPTDGYRRLRPIKSSSRGNEAHYSGYRSRIKSSP